jgi:alpha-galactosidase/6-phospho-beta-glucosidase family protein
MGGIDVRNQNKRKKREEKEKKKRRRKEEKKREEKEQNAYDEAACGLNRILTNFYVALGAICVSNSGINGVII